MLVPALLPAQSTVGRLLVANQQAASASIVELSTGEVTHVPVGNGPHETAISPDGKWGVVGIYGIGGAPGNQLAVIDMAQKKVVRTIDLGTYTRPHALVSLKDAPFRVVATSETTQNIVTVNVETGEVISVTATGAAGSHMVALAADEKRAFSANVFAGSMTSLDLSQKKNLGTIPIAPRSEGIAVTPSGHEAWVGSNEHGTVSIVNTAALKIDTVLAGFGVPYRLAVSPDGKVAVIVEAEANQISIVDVKTRKTVGAVPVGGSPRGVSISPDNKLAFITLGPQAEVLVVDLAAKRVRSRHKVQAAPDGVAYSLK
jgi:YVTN family beta-propeller protein